MKRLRKIFLLAALMLSIQFGMSTTVYAADGRLYIAVSDTNVSVGNTVKVTLSARGSNNEAATADMTFTYDTNVFSFVSCDTDNYSGGEGGTVNVSGGKVVITLEAIDNGSGRVTVTGGNGKIIDSQQALTEMVASGVTLQAGSGTAEGSNETNEGNSGTSEGSSETSEGNSGNSSSTDNGLAGLTLSAGELSPAFSSTITKYTAQVSYETTAVEVTPQLSNESVTVGEITGTSELQVGENTVTIPVKSEDGSEKVYTILITRLEEGVQPIVGTQQTEPGQTTDSETEAGLSAEQIEEYEGRISQLSNEYSKLQEKYQQEKSSSRKIMAILIFIIAVLIIICVNFLVARNRRAEDDDFDFYDEKEDRKRKVNFAGEKKERKINAENEKKERKIDFEDEDLDFPQEKKEKKRKGLFFQRDDDDDEWLDDDDDDWLYEEEEIQSRNKKQDVKERKDIEFIDFDDF